MKKFFKLFLVFTIGLCLMHAYPVQAQTTEGLTVKKFDVQQTGHKIKYTFELNREATEEEMYTNLFIEYEYEQDPENYRGIRHEFQLKDFKKESGAIYTLVYELPIFDFQIFAYGKYNLVNVAINGYNDYFDYDCKQSDVCKPDSIELTEEMNPLETATEKDFYVEPGFAANFQPFAKEYPILYYKDGTSVLYLNTEFEDAITEGTGEYTKTFECDVPIAYEKTKKMTFTGTMEYSEEPDGIILDFQEKTDEPVVYEVTAKYEDFRKALLKNDLEVFFKYKVLLKDGTIIEEKIPRVVGAPDMSEDGYLVISGQMKHINVRYSYYLDPEVAEMGGYPGITFIFHLIDENNNIVNDQGVVIKSAAERGTLTLKPADNTEKGVSVSMKEGTLPSYTEVKTEEVKLDKVFDKNDYVAYDISMKADYVNVQPAGDVEVSVKLPENLLNKEVEVYYVADDGSKEKVEVVGVKDGVVTFKTDHFSTYAIVATGEKEDVAPEGGNKPEDKPGTDTNADEKPGTETKPDVKPEEKPQDKPEDKVESDKSETPKTGDNSMITMFGLMAVLSACVLVVLKKKERKVD